MKTLFSLFLLSMILLVPKAQAQVPETMAYQGYLTDAEGNPLDGTVNLAFRLYDAPAGGTAAWAESQLDVPVSEGVFSVQLGRVESFGGVAFDKPLWLVVHVNGGNELSPRVALDAAPYALSTRGLRVIPASGGAATAHRVAGVNAVSIVAGDASNTIEAGADGATISGGYENYAGRGATVGGGQGNDAIDCYDTVGGGSNNRAQGVTAGGKTSGSICGATVGGGNSNAASGEVATVGGGYRNEASGGSSTVGGGANNTASGRNSTVPGGSNNIAAGAYSFAAGLRAEANHDGTFVWAGAGSAGASGKETGGGSAFTSTAENQFLIRAAGGVGIGTNAPQGALHVTHPTDDPDLVLGGVEENVLVGDDGIITSDPNLPSSDLLLVANNTVGMMLLDTDDENPSEFTVLNSSFGRVFRVNLDGAAIAGSMALEDDLEADAAPAEGGVYRDNVVYAWAHVNADGTVAASFGCTVLRTGTGQYSITYDRVLTNGAAPVVSPLSANAPVIATVAPSGTDGADVKLFGFVNGQFQFQDRPFFVQVVGRP